MLDAFAIRLEPQQDLKAELDRLMQQQTTTAACILTCVGSLTQARLRHANQPDATLYQGHFEIVSLTGVMSVHGSHYHISIADSTGKTIGGHLLEGCFIYTTAEIVIGVLPHLRFQREHDAVTGFRELAISHCEPSPNSTSPGSAACEPLSKTDRKPDSKNTHIGETV